MATTTERIPGYENAEFDTAKYPPPPPETPQERKIRLTALFVIPFLMVTMMYATYMGTMHAPTPENVPVAVAGSGAEQVASALTEALGDTVEIEVVEADEARDAVAERDVAAAVLLSDEGNTLYTAMAGGPSRASTAQNVLIPALTGMDIAVTGEDVVPLTEGDGTGTMVLFAAMGFMLAGYVPLSMIFSGVPNLLRLKKFVPFALGWSAVLSTLIWTILGPIVGAVDGHYLTFLGVGMLTISATLCAQLVFTRLVGPLAVLVGMLLWVVFGVPASGLALALESMPGFLQFLHHVLPLGQAGEAIRSVVYFDAADAWPHLAVVAAWLVGALGLATLLERKQDLRISAAPLYTDKGAPLAALPGGPVASYRGRLLGMLGFPFVIVATVVGLMSFGMQKPIPSDMPVAVVGVEQATTPFVQGVGEQMGDYVDLKATTDLEQAKDDLEAGDVVGVYVLPTTQGGSPELFVATGAGAAQATTVKSMFTPIAQAGEQQGGGPIEITDVAPLTENDLGGSNSMYVGMAWIMAGFLITAVFRGGAPDLTRTRQILPMLGGWAIGMSVWLWFLFDVLIGAVNGHALALLGMGALTIFCVSLASSVFTRVFGLGALIPVMILIMLAGVPASGGGLSVWMAPEIFRWLADWLPLPAAIDFARAVTYFAGVGIGANITVIVIWGVVGLLLNLLVVDRIVNRAGARPPAPLGPKYMPERGPKDEGSAADSSDVDDEAGEPELVGSPV